MAGVTIQRVAQPPLLIAKGLNMGLPRDPKSLKSLIDDSMERIGSVIRETLRLNLGVLGEPFAVSQIRLTGDGRGERSSSYG